MKRFRRACAGITILSLLVALAGCGGGARTGAASGQGTTSPSREPLPTVKMMVGGIDKQIYLPYQLAQNLGYYKKYGVNVELSTEKGGVGAETALVSGQVEFAGVWYVNTINLLTKGKSAVSVAQLSGAPGEREMCATGSNVQSPADWKGTSVGVTELGSGTDNLTLYLAARNNLSSKDFNRVGVGAGSTLISAMQNKKIVCAMTTQPTVAALEKSGVGYSAIDLSSPQGAQKWLGGPYPAAAVLARADWVNANKDTVQRVVNALVATMRYISTASAADIANNLPANFVSSSTFTKDDYIKALEQDKGQFLPDGMMPANGPQTVLSIQKFVGKAKGTEDLSKTYTNEFAIAANKLEGYTK